METRRVVITGLGIVSSLGIGTRPFWENLLAGKSGISDIFESFHTSRYSPQKGGEVKDFKLDEAFSRRNIGRASQFAIAASEEALEDARLTRGCLTEKKTGALFGTTNGESQVLEEIDRIWLDKGESEVWAKTIVKYPLDSIANNVAYHLKISGASKMIPTACSAGNYSIGYAYDLIRLGKLDIAIAGGADPLTRYAFAGFGRLFAMAPEKCQPFDKNRKGMMVGEGAAVLILEELESARERGADIYCEVLGYALSCDAHHMTAPRAEGIEQVMEKAVKTSRIAKEDVDYISAHGTGTPANDRTECQAIRKVFGELTKRIAVSSIKSMLGHTMGAASAIEAAACCLAIKDSMIPPTINYETPDPGCDIDCVPNVARKREVKIALNNSFAFGGNNACLVLGKING
jgi:3-oxoacyl-[acyl-carrier-protein] synthase II